MISGCYEVDRRGPGVTVLLVDVMDTLVVDPFYEAVPAYFGMGFDAMLEAKDPEAWLEFERGRIDEPTFLARFFADRRAFHHDAFRAHLARSYRWVPGMQALVEELAGADVTMHVLSNYPRWYKLIETQLGVGRLVPWTFVSCETGRRKPEPEAFAGAARWLDVAPERCVVVDDRERNCTAARALGMDAVPFADAAQLRAALHERGVL